LLGRGMEPGEPAPSPLAWAVAAYDLLTVSYIAATYALKVPSKPEIQNHWLVGLWYVFFIGWLPLSLMFTAGMLCHVDGAQRAWLEPVTISLIDVSALLLWLSGTEFFEPMGNDLSEKASWMPPLYLVGTILSILLAYNCTQLLGGVDLSVEQSLPAPLRVVYWVLVVLWLASYIRVSVTPPGGLADCGGEPETRQSKNKWNSCNICSEKRPQRCKHCRICNTCVLRMDHHCPWLRRCIGYQNYKYFYVFIFYTAASLLFKAATLLPFVVKLRINGALPFWTKALLGFPAGAVALLSVLLTGFLGFHTYLAWNALTTIDWIHREGATYNYNQGVYRNFQAILGSNPLLWLLPISPPDGDGATFPYVVWQGAEGKGAHVRLVEGHLVSQRSAMDQLWVEERSAPTCFGDMRDHCIEAATAGGVEEFEEEPTLFDEGL